MYVTDVGTHLLQTDIYC